MLEEVDETLPVTTLGETTRTLPLAEGRSSPVPTGTLIGRYVVLSKLGAGAMGLVLGAYDPELDRKVALKLLGTPRAGASKAAQRRLQREAQALAKLDHPNVVGVHDVGVHEGHLFVAMEFVEGRTLGAWMAAVDEPRPWPEVVRVFAEAGRGLSAAHEADLVHRDFKPDNVMLGADGRVRVMDFGLVRASEDDDPSESTYQRVRRTVGNQDQLIGLTQTGTLLGTPAYMSIEQFDVCEADARSDQFGFCVALYEALYGERPFPGASLGELIQAVRDEVIREAPKRAKVPSWLREVVVRGLAADPARRWPSMAALLDALADDPVRRRRKWWIGGLAAGLIGAGAWAVGYAVDRDAQVCTGMDTYLVDVWDDRRRAQVRAAIEATGLSYAPETWTRVERRLDAYTSEWVAAREQTCEATHRGEQSGELLDLRMACLDERLQHVRATVDVLAVADEGVVEKATRAVAGLPTLARCDDVNALKAELPVPEDPEVARRVAELDERLVEARALQEAGKYADGLKQADAVLAEASPLGYEPLQVRAWLRQGSLQARMGEYEAAEATLEQTYESAVGLGMKTEAAAASVQLTSVVGVDLGRYDDARRWARHAKPWARVVETDEAWSLYLSSLGMVANAEGNYEEARDYHEQSLAIREQALGADHPSVAHSLSSLGNVADRLGNYAEARGYHQRSLAIKETALGPWHPEVASSLVNLGNAVLMEGDYEGARGYLERALAIDEGTLGPEHPNVAITSSNLGLVEYQLGRFEEARGYQERALAIQEQALGPRHPSVGFTLDNLGLVVASQGAYAEALGYHERALAILEQALGPQHRDVGACLVNLGSVAQQQGAYERARGYHERALAILEQALGLDSPLLAYPLAGLGEALIGLSAPAEAIPQLERALVLRASAEGSPFELASVRFALARALTGVGRDRDRARELAEQAEVDFAGAGERATKELAEVRTWLAQQAG